MPIIEADLENVFYEWCTTVTGIEFIIASQSAGGYRPRQLYGTISLTLFDGTVLKDRRYEEILGSDDVTEIVRIRPTVAVSVNIYGDGGKTEILKLKASTQQTNTNEFFQINNVGFTTHSQIRSLPRVNRDDHENRAQCDFNFNTIGEYFSDVKTIGRVEILNELNNSEIIVEEK